MSQMSLPSQKNISFKQSPPNQPYKLLKLIFLARNLQLQSSKLGIQQVPGKTRPF